MDWFDLLAGVGGVDSISGWGTTIPLFSAWLKKKKPTKTRKHDSRFQGRQEADYTALWWGVGVPKEDRRSHCSSSWSGQSQDRQRREPRGEDAETSSPWDSGSTGSRGLIQAWSRVAPAVEEAVFSPMTASQREARSQPGETGCGRTWAGPDRKCGLTS